MQKKTHLSFGMFIGAFAIFIGLPLPFLFLVGFISFFPDIDWLINNLWLKPESHIKKMWFRIFKQKSMHRTLFHNVWVMLIILLTAGIFTTWNFLVLISISIGFLSHLLLDSLTVSGIYWLWPYGDEKIFKKRKFYYNGKFVTGSSKEKLVSTVFIILGGVMLGLTFVDPVRQTTSELLISIGVFSIVGFLMFEVFLDSVSKTTSRMFR